MEGGKLRKLLSWVRTSGLKSDVGRSAGATYLKQLANQRVVRVKRKSSLSPSTAASETDLASPRSTSVDSPQESPTMQEPSMEIIDQTMILLGLDPNTACSQYHIYEAVEEHFGKPALKSPPSTVSSDSTMATTPKELTGEWNSTPLAAPVPPIMLSMPDESVVNPRDQLSLIDPASPPTTPAEAVGSCKWMQGPEGMPPGALPQAPRKGRRKAFRIVKLGMRDGADLVEKPTLLQKSWLGDINAAWESAKQESGWDK
eukprot:s9_g86.t2